MALYYNLPIYKASYKLMEMLFSHSSGFSREYKYTVGQDMKKEGSELIKNIYRANQAADKIVHLGQARENLEMIRLFTRLMQDFKQLSLKKFVEINQAIEEVSKQLAGWEKYNKSNVHRLTSNEERQAASVQRSTPLPARQPPESSAAREQASARSKSNNHLAFGEEFCPTPGHIAPLHQKNSAINSEVILPLAGNRNRDTAGLNNRGSNGNYWSGSPSSTNASNLNFNSGGVNPANANNRANGFSVRCVKDLRQAIIKKSDSQQLLLDLFRAYFDTRKNKRSTANALAFEAGYEEKLFKLYNDIINREYKSAKAFVSSSISRSSGKYSPRISATASCII